MIYVKIEHHQHGRASEAKVIGEIYIANDGTGDSDCGSYIATMQEYGADTELAKGGIAKVSRHFRPLGVLSLIHSVLDTSCVPDPELKATNPRDALTEILYKKKHLPK